MSENNRKEMALLPRYTDNTHPRQYDMVVSEIGYTGLYKLFSEKGVFICIVWSSEKKDAGMTVFPLLAEPFPR